MRYFLLIFAVCVAGGDRHRRANAAACRANRRSTSSRTWNGSSSCVRRNPNGFFANGVSSQLPRARHDRARQADSDRAPDWFIRTKMSPVFTGRVTGTTNFVENNPLPVDGATAAARAASGSRFIARPATAQEADGNGITKKIGAMAVGGQPARQTHRRVAGRRNLLRHHQWPQH